MSHNEVDILKRALEREKKGKAAAEKVIEQRIRELYLSNLNLNKKIRSHEQTMSLVFDNMLDAVFVFAPDGTILQANKAAYDLSGHKFEDQNLTHIDKFSTVNASRIKQMLEKAFAEKSSFNFDFPFLSASKKQKVINVRTSMLLDDQKNIVGLQAIASDITSATELKQIQAAERRQLEIENEIFEAVLQSNDIHEIGWKIVSSIAKFLESDDAVLYVNIDNELVQIASLEEKSKGSDFIENPIRLELGQGIVGQVAQTHQPRIVNNTQKVEEYVVQDQTRLSEITVPILLGDELIGIIDSEHAQENHYTQKHLDFLVKISNFIALGLKNSINELKIKQKDKDLKLSAERLENMIESLPNGIAFENNKNIIVYLNQKFIDLFGLPAKTSDVIGMHCDQARTMLSTVFPESEKFAERTIEIIKNRQIVTDDTLKLLDGRTVTRHYAPVYQDGEFIGNLWAYADNTIETRFYENLNFEREKYMNIIANMELGLLEVDNEDRILTANNAFLKMTNYSEEDLIGKIGYQIFVTEKEAQRIKDMNASRIQGESSIYEIEYFTKERESRYMMVSGGPNRDIKGNVIGSVGIHLDITKLKELEKLREELITDLTASNDELSNYAHVVSHDLKTPLRSISAAMSWLKEDNKESLNEMSQSYLEIVDEALVKMDKIISDTLRYSEMRQKLTTDSNVDLNHLTAHLINELKQSYPETSVEVVGALPTVTMNETKIMQVFQNILDNACKYRDPNKESKVKISCSFIFGFFEFSIEDNGIGIAKEHAHHVFEIFQKLNNNEGSNGIGMSIVKKIIDSYGGKIWFESELGQGTTFKFNLPGSLRSATAAQ
jgi:PAS domain S-box-containing protein